MQVYKYREKGRLGKIEKKIIFRTERQLHGKLQDTLHSKLENMTFIERNNLISRQ
ncbi:MAG: hypothetical protein ACFFD2_05440 [Promethearchaeota archaeon]